MLIGRTKPTNRGLVVAVSSFEYCMTGGWPLNVPHQLIPERDMPCSPQGTCVTHLLLFITTHFFLQEEEPCIVLGWVS